MGFFSNPWEFERPEDRTERESLKFRSVAQSIMDDIETRRREEESRKFREMAEPIVAETARREEESSKFRNTVWNMWDQREKEVERFHELIQPTIDSFQPSVSPSGRFSDRFDEVNKDIVNSPEQIAAMDEQLRKAWETDTGAPAGEPNFPGVVGKIPGFRNPAELAATVGTAGIGTTGSIGARALQAGAQTALGSLGAAAGGPAAEKLGLPDWTGELAGGLVGGGVGRGWADDAISRNPFSRDAIQGLPKRMLAEETGGSRLIGPDAEIPPSKDVALDPFQSAVKKTIAALRVSRKNYDATEAIRSGQRGERGAEYDAILQRELAKGTDPREANRIASGALAGGYEPIPGVKVDLDDAERAAMTIRLSSADVRSFERKNALDALVKLEDGKAITPYYINLLKRIYGDEFGDAITEAQKKTPGFWDRAFDVAVLPKAILSSFDLSYPLRQGIMLAPGHPKEFLGSFTPMFKAYTRERVARGIYDDIVNDTRTVTVNGVVKSLGQVKEDTGLLRALDAGSDQAEEAMRGSLAERIPIIGAGVRASNRAFVTFGNKFRSDTFDTIVRTWERRGVELNDKRLQDLSNMLNRFSGRGTLNDSRLTQLMQATWWAPQYRVSGPQAVAQAFNFKDRPVQMEAIRNLVAFTLTGTSILTAAKLGGLNVETDPRSSDFGKIRLPGGMRINFWGTNQLLARTVTQLVTGERFNRALGPATKTSRQDVFWKYVRSGLAPEISAIHDVIAGENYMGEEINLSKESLTREFYERLAPLFFQDALKAIKEAVENPSAGTIGGAAVGVPLALFGGGVQTYTSPVERLQQSYDKKFDTPYRDEASVVRSANIANDPALATMNAARDTDSQKINLETEQPLTGVANAVMANTPNAGEAYRQQRGDALQIRQARKDQLFQGKDMPSRAADKLSDQYFALQPTDQNGNGFVDSEDMKAFFKARDQLLSQMPDPIRAALTDPAKRFSDPNVVAAERRYQASMETYKIYLGTPKYKGLTAEQSDHVDAARQAIDYLKTVKAPYSQRQEIVKSLTPEERRVYYRVKSGSSFIQDPRRDKLVMDNPDLAYFGLVSTNTLSRKQRRILPDYALESGLRADTQELVGGLTG